jgi:hypothetical protein
MLKSIWRRLPPAARLLESEAYEAACFVGSGTCQRSRFFSAIISKPLVALSVKTAAIQASPDCIGVTTLRPRTATTLN